MNRISSLLGSVNCNGATYPHGISSSAIEPTTVTDGTTIVVEGKTKRINQSAEVLLDTRGGL